MCHRVTNENEMFYIEPVIYITAEMVLSLEFLHPAKSTHALWHTQTQIYWCSLLNH